MTPLAFIVIGAAVVLSPVVAIVRKYGWNSEAVDKWMFDAPLGEIFRVRATMLFGGALMLFGMVFAR